MPRPKKTKSQLRSERKQFRFTRSEWRDIMRAAKLAGMDDTTAWVRGRLVPASRRVIAKHSGR